MIKGLYEAHLPVSNIQQSITFYKNLDLELAWQDEDSAFFWIEKGMSWLGIWEDQQAVSTPYHPSLRHVAFRIDYSDLEEALQWLKEKGIEPTKDAGLDPIEPTVRPYQKNASVYFADPDGNSLELMCSISNDSPQKRTKMYLSDWKNSEK